MWSVSCVLPVHCESKATLSVMHAASGNGHKTRVRNVYGRFVGFPAFFQTVNHERIFISVNEKGLSSLFMVSVPVDDTKSRPYISSGRYVERIEFRCVPDCLQCGLQGIRDVIPVSCPHVRECYNSVGVGDEYSLFVIPRERFLVVQAGVCDTSRRTACLSGNVCDWIVL